MEYLITPTSASDWKINQIDFIESLKYQWLNIELNLISNSQDFYSLEWTIKSPNKKDRLDGALHRDGQGISLDGNLEICATFAIWFRSLIPFQQPLVFYDQGYNFDVILQINTKKSDIIASCLTII